MNVLRWMALVAVLMQNVPPRPVGTASVEGVVMKLGTNEPIAGADLELTRQPDGDPASVPPPYTAISGADGKFAFRNIASGTYKLVAARIGGNFTPFEYGQRGTLGRGVLFSLGNGEAKKDVRMDMAPVGSITGRILDTDNRPVGHASVMAMSPVYRNGERIVTIMEVVHSDDHGEFRLFSLTPGRYYVAARLEDLTRRTAALGYYPPGRILASDRVESPVVTKHTLPTGQVIEETYQLVYFGGGTNADLAAPIEVRAGAAVAGIDISAYQGKIPSRHIRGKIAVSGGASIPVGARIVAVPQRYSSDMPVPTGAADAGGAFDLAGAVPGKYFLTALVPADPNNRTTPPPQPQFGYALIEVGEQDLEGVSVSTAAGFPISGKLSIENKPDDDPNVAKLRLELTREPNIQGFPQLNPNSKFSLNGEFSMSTVSIGDYTVQITGLPALGYAKSVRLGSRDLLQETLHVDAQPLGRIEVVVATDASTLTGHVVDERQDPAVNVKVVLVPDVSLRRRWDLYKSTMTDPSGNFSIKTIPPGDYKVFAWEDVPDNIWTIPESLRVDESRGRSIRIGSATTERIELTAIPAARR